MVVQMTVKKDLGLDDAEAVERLTQLAILLPGLLPRLPAIKARIVVTMAQDTSVSSPPITSWCHLSGPYTELNDTYCLYAISSGLKATQHKDKQQLECACRKWRKSSWRSRLFFQRQMLQTCSCNGLSTSWPLMPMQWRQMWPDCRASFLMSIFKGTATAPPTGTVQPGSKQCMLIQEDDFLPTLQCICISWMSSNAAVKSSTACMQLAEEQSFMQVCNLSKMQVLGLSDASLDAGLWVNILRSLMWTASSRLSRKQSTSCPA